VALFTDVTFWKISGCNAKCVEARDLHSLLAFVVVFIIMAYDMWHLRHCYVVVIHCCVWQEGGRWWWLWWMCNFFFFNYV